MVMFLRMVVVRKFPDAVYDAKFLYVGIYWIRDLSKFIYTIVVMSLVVIYCY